MVDSIDRMDTRQKLVDIEEEIKQAKEELAKERRMNMDLWKQYGSELCSAEMSRSERRIENRIKVLQMARDQILELLRG